MGHGYKKGRPCSPVSFPPAVGLLPLLSLALFSPLPFALCPLPMSTLPGASSSPDPSSSTGPSSLPGPSSPALYPPIDRPRRGPIRLIVLCDGTWQSRQTVFTKIQHGVATSKSEKADWFTNVALLSQSIMTAAARPDADGYVRPQLTHYISGVGATPDLVEKVTQGATGDGVDEKVLEGITFLYDNYQRGDEIFLFGFSRGAFTARCISGFLDFCGVLTKPQSVRLQELWKAYSERRPDQPWTVAKAAYILHDITGRWPSSRSVMVSSVAFDILRGTFAEQVQAAAKTIKVPQPIQTAADAAQQYDPAHMPPLEPSIEPVPIKVVGVWDTVGALGLPGLFGTPGFKHVTSFFDPGLGMTIENAFHALSLHEDRKDFLPTLWYQQNDHPPNQTLKQTWFQGCHTDVGGGYPLHGLSDITLAWMVAQLQDHPSGPLLGIDLEHLKSLQDKRYAWAKQNEHDSRMAVELQAVRQVDKERLSASDLVGVVWSDMLKGDNASRNESIHHSVVVGGKYDPDQSPQFESLRKENPGKLQSLWQQASDSNTLLPTERFLSWGAGTEDAQANQTVQDRVIQRLESGSHDISKLTEQIRNKFHVANTNNLREGSLEQGLDSLRSRLDNNPLTMPERVRQDSGK